MNAADWLTLSLVCLAGAASPGMSLAMIIKNTIAAGSSAGILASWTHAFGIFFYALITVFGMGIVFEKLPWLFNVLLILGALYLLRIGILSFLQFFKESTSSSDFTANNAKAKIGNSSSYVTAAKDGLSIAIFNPKVLLFFGAIFTGFIQQQSTLEKISMGLVALLTDGIWYSFIALLIGIPKIRNSFLAHQKWLSLIFGFVFCGYALYLAAGALIL